MLRAVSKVSVTLTKKWNQRTMGHLISYSKNSESDNPPPDPSASLCTAISLQYSYFMAIPHHSCAYTVLSCQSCPCTVISSQPRTCKLALYRVCHVSHFLNSQTSFQPRGKAGLLSSKQSAHTDSNLIRIRQPDTRY